MYSCLTVGGKYQVVDRQE